MEVYGKGVMETRVGRRRRQIFFFLRHQRDKYNNRSLQKTNVKQTKANRILDNQGLMRLTLHETLAYCNCNAEIFCSLAFNLESLFFIPIIL